MAVVHADRPQDATGEVEMNDLVQPSCGDASPNFKAVVGNSKCKPVYINTDNCVLRRTFSAPSGGAGETDSSSHTPCSVSPSTRCNSNSKTNDYLHLPRARTYSAELPQMTLNVDCSGSTSASPVSIGSPVRRIMQIRREESVDELTREVAKERDITSVLNLSKSLDETAWLGMKGVCTDMDVVAASCSSLPSPVKFTDQKISYNQCLTPSPISIPISPRQTTYRRSSVSPSGLRPSLLSSKRKLDPDADCEAGGFLYCTPAKRHSMFCSPTNSHHTLSSFSSNSSPERASDVSSNHFSCDSDSGGEHGFTPTNSSTRCAVMNTLLSCNAQLCGGGGGGGGGGFNHRHNSCAAPQSPQSPLASHSGCSNTSHDSHENKRKLLNTNSNTPVKD